MNTSEKLKDIIKWIDEKNAKNTLAINVQQINSSTDYFVITTALNERNSKAICDHLEEKMSQSKIIISGKEGYDKGRWILIDLSDVVVNIFVEEERTIYNLEKLYSGGIFMDLGEFSKDETI